MWAVWRGNLVVEKAWQDEGDGGGTSGSDVGQDRVKRRDNHGDEVGQHHNKSGDDGKLEVTNDLNWSPVGVQKLWASRWVKKWSLTVWRLGHLGLAFGDIGGWSPVQDGDTGGSAWVALERVGEHDKNDNGELSNGGGDVWSVHLHDVTLDIVSVGKVSGDGDNDVDDTGGTNGGENDGRDTTVR